ncbi:carboxymuconolactone decarboxylase family protein [Streptomyces sp. NBC_01210]|uniref:carboxymuconolactone decarboxylase family protein n=1 Tax=Streptomyces sp. NBC_01210 TaxID=2903774 RepID=UPI002E167521|nr:carboxymuconolactone decarboxylase family protein [Streptomyces sp. NBC_01210]
MLAHRLSAGSAATAGSRQLPPVPEYFVGRRAPADIHTQEAAAAGETAVRLNLVVAWREATVFTEAERAALELAEQGTRIADAAGGVTDEVWAYAAKHYDEEQLTALVVLVSFMNTVNRLNVITQQPAGNYAPGQFH